MNILSKLYYRYKKLLKILRLYLIIAGPGIIVMVADNDAGGITTYTATGAQYGFHLIWFLILLGPVAYYVQEMTVRLGLSPNAAMPKLSFMRSGRSGVGSRCSILCWWTG